MTNGASRGKIDGHVIGYSEFVSLDVTSFTDRSGTSLRDHGICVFDVTIQMVMISVPTILCNKYVIMHLCIQP